MKRIMRALREIHRRLLWVPVAIYIFFSILAYQASHHIIERQDLPIWFVDFALLLLVVGLPIILTTTIVQEGIPRLGRSDPSLNIALAEDASDPDALEVGRTPPGLWAIFTWRNAALGGVAAFILYLLVAGAWLLLAEQLVDDAQKAAVEEPALEPPN